MTTGENYKGPRVILFTLGNNAIYDSHDPHFNASPAPGAGDPPRSRSMGALEDLVASHLGGFSPEGGVHLPNTPGYDACLLSAGAANYACLHERRRPPVALQPARESDVVLAVRFVTAGIERGLWPEGGRVDGSPDGGDGVPLTLCGGGHSELCVRHGAVLIHFGRMASVSCDPAAGTVTIAPGALLGAMNEAAQNHGLAVPTGVFAGVGVGSILAGGIGRLARARGLSVHSVVAMRVVTADGEIHVLGEGTHMDGLARDMWWGCRGAAAALGVVTSVTLRAAPIAPTVSHGRRIYPTFADAPDAAARLRRIETIARALPEATQVDVCVTRAAGGGGGGVRIGVFPCATDGGDVPADVVASLELTPRHVTRSRYCDVPYHSMLPDDELDDESAPGDDGTPSQATPGMFSYVRQWFVDELGEIGAAAVAAAAAAAPTDDSLVMMQHAGGAVRRGGRPADDDDAPADDDLSFPHRQWEWSVVIIALWTDPSSRARTTAEAWADDAFESLRGCGVGCYAVDIDRFRRSGADAEEEVKLAFGEVNAARLRELKRRVDPMNVFAAAVPL